jgi:indolepyruvate ferredoxin oxidoreductase alpha subunit
VDANRRWSYPLLNEKVMLSGNEAIARGAYEAGVKVAAGYPGTPSTEILENIVRYPDIYAEWSPNEKVALEVALGAAIAGARALVAMKHVGLNVAADPLFTASYTGVAGGLVVVSADDPGMHSSQNEQDNRNYAPFAKVPMLEPADSEEARDYTVLAFQISEDYDTPVLVRTTTRVSHAKSVVTLKEPLPYQIKEYKTNAEKYVMIPAYARMRRRLVEERTAKLLELSERIPINRIEWNDAKMGIVTSGVSYQYVREVAPDASVLKLGMTWPLPAEMIRKFASRVEMLYVVEELDPYLENHIRALGIEVAGKRLFGPVGELSPDLVARGLFGIEPLCLLTEAAEESIPARPPVLCPGCPHRPVFYILRKVRAIVTGDIGCYTLSVLPPLETHDTCVCMGASIGVAIGMDKAMGQAQKRPIVAVIGDSTFVHSGITPLVDAVYNKAKITTIILDNRTTAMTGGQDHPATGRTLSGEATHALDLGALARAIGVEHVAVVDPYDLTALEKAIRAAIAFDGPSVVIPNRPCVLIDRSLWEPALVVDEDLCEACGLCFRIGCPGIEGVEAGGKKGRMAYINASMCTGCEICAQVCKFEAISRRRSGVGRKSHRPKAAS